MAEQLNSGSPLVDPSVPALVSRMAQLSKNDERDNSDLRPPGENIGSLWQVDKRGSRLRDAVPFIALVAGSLWLICALLEGI